MARKVKTPVVPETEPEVQPTGRVFGTTLEVVNEVLVNPEFAEEVKRHNDLPADLDAKTTAILFLAARYQGMVDLLDRRTAFLNAQTEGNTRRVVSLEDAVFKR